ncbi:GlxA family transcriptional regulator [Pseudoalteromonas maricaloris]|uniref:GlxA family transcriptional regulator n=1 Tax=Pseudoalteromonas maricaloris TaxID=184924 RepID=UPI0006908EBC|nr:helix-turn-helix domain-containing protein [Pseudoalteromonas flavipulchra]MBD0783047.1 helix-turn-helix domain-containing protein [Pseudoalteromonas flavipulchra]MBE0374693.1 AraC family transcriptional regulator, transcriptional activator FtrA [Pseudoalteromonas flavipulchra NCIMB 2033 = ATCC BAA-314]
MGCESTLINLHILVVDGFVPYDLAVAYQMFFVATKECEQPSYNIQFVGSQGQVQSDSFIIGNVQPLSTIGAKDTLIVPGLYTPTTYDDENVLRAIRAAYQQGSRIASICNGSLLLAKSGVLDGKRATSHWDAFSEFEQHHTAVDLLRDVLYVDEGQVITSAGLSAGQGLCLHIIKGDFGATLANKVAERFVMPLERGFSHPQQYRPVYNVLNDIQRVQLWLSHNYHKPITLAEIAEHACMTSRALTRNFNKYVGQSPMMWLRELRVQRAQILLETTTFNINVISELSGFGTVVNFRIAFKRYAGCSPTEWRCRYNNSHVL